MAAFESRGAVVIGSGRVDAAEQGEFPSEAAGAGLPQQIVGVDEFPLQVHSTAESTVIRVSPLPRTGI